MNLRQNFLTLVPEKDQEKFKESLPHAKWLTSLLLEFYQKKFEAGQNKLLAYGEEQLQADFAIRQAILVGQTRAYRDIVDLLKGMQ